MYRTGFAAVLVLVVGLAGPPPAGAISLDDYTGSVDLVGLPYCPSGSVELWGQELRQTDQPALFALLGNRFGGDPAGKTFKLPDLQGAAPAGMRYCLRVNGTFPPRS